MVISDSVSGCYLLTTDSSGINAVTSKIYLKKKKGICVTIQLVRKVFLFMRPKSLASALLYDSSDSG